MKEPIEVWVAGRFRMQDEELGNVVGVQAAERFFEAGEVAGGGLDEEQDFGRGFNFALPTIDGGEAGDDVGAGGEALVYEGAGDALGFVLGAGGGEDEADFGGGYNHRCVFRRSQQLLAGSIIKVKRTGEKHGGGD